MPEITPQQRLPDEEFRITSSTSESAGSFFQMSM
jgi:hypothetical protein